MFTRSTLITNMEEATATMKLSAIDKVRQGQVWLMFHDAWTKLSAGEALLPEVHLGVNSPGNGKRSINR